MKKCAILFLIFVFMIGCGFGLHEIFYRANPVDSRTKDFVKISPPTTETDYDVLLIADTHIGSKKFTMPTESFFKWLDNHITANRKPEFCIMLGDAVDHGTKPEFDEYKKFQKRIQDKGIPIYNVLGNHDIYNSGWKLWKETCYPHLGAFYFETTNFTWIFADTANGTLGRPQFFSLKKKLESSSKPKLFFTHYPLYGNAIPYFTLTNPRERAELISMFGKNNVKLYSSGHFHPGRDFNYGAFKEKVARSLGQFGQSHILHINENNASFSIKSFDVSK